MDNKKIGKLIANLRKQKGLTQQELGDKVGVGFRAVSKWERGITTPDISIINDVSKILGISSDELLNGKTKDKNKDKNKLSYKLKIILFLLVIPLTTIILILIYFNTKTYTYTLESTTDDYRVEGQVILHQNDINIILNKLHIFDNELLETKIKNYEYQIYNGDKILFGYGNTEATVQAKKINTIKEFTEIFRVNFNINSFENRREILKNNLILKLTFETNNGEIITEEIKIKLTKTENSK